MYIKSGGEIRRTHVLLILAAVSLCVIAAIWPTSAAAPLTDRQIEATIQARILRLEGVEIVDMLEIVGKNAVYAEIRTAPGANRQTSASRIMAQIRAQYPAVVWISLILDDGQSAYDFTQAEANAAWKITAIR